MKQTNNLTTRPIHSSPLGKPMLIGAMIALIVILIFLLDVDNPNPAWGKFWMVKPLIMVPFAGALGGVFYYMMDFLRYQGGWKSVMANILSILGYIIVLWLGTVLGLNGTLWN